MTDPRQDPAEASTPPAGFPPLLEALRGLILQARQKALCNVDVIQVQTCWQIGRHIVEFEQGGQARAAYGKRLLGELAEGLTREFGKRFAFVARQQRVSTETQDFLFFTKYGLCYI